MWEILANDGYRYVKDPSWELHVVFMAHDRRYVLWNRWTNVSVTINTRGGVYTAMDISSRYIDERYPVPA